MASLTSEDDFSSGSGSPDSKPKLDHSFNARSAFVFLGIIACGLGCTAWSIWSDMRAVGAPVVTYLPFVLLGVALLIAFGSEFVNGFHDTANAVAT